MELETITTVVGSVAAGGLSTLGLSKLLGKKKDPVVKVEAEPAKAPALEKVSNKERKFGANDHYWHVKLTYKGEEQEFMLTDSDLDKAKTRAGKNPEDIPS